MKLRTEYFLVQRNKFNLCKVLEVLEDGQSSALLPKMISDGQRQNVNLYKYKEIMDESQR